MSDSLSCVSPDLLAHGDGIVVVFSLLMACVLIGGLWGVFSSWLALPLDRAYRWLLRLPECKPGRCYCRRTCICLIQEPLE